MRLILNGLSSFLFQLDFFQEEKTFKSKRSTMFKYQLIQLFPSRKSSFNLMVSI